MNHPSHPGYTTPPRVVRKRANDIARECGVEPYRVLFLLLHIGQVPKSDTWTVVLQPIEYEAIKAVLTSG